MRIETDKIYCGDSLQVLQTLPENAVDCCVTSPPYYALRDYGADGQIGREATPEEYVSRITAVFHEVKRGAYAGGYLLAEYRGHLLRHRQQSRPPRPQISQRQERAASGGQPPRPRLQAERLNRCSVACSPCLAGRRLVFAQFYYLVQNKPYAGKLQRPSGTLL